MRRRPAQAADPASTETNMSVAMCRRISPLLLASWRTRAPGGLVRANGFPAAYGEAQAVPGLRCDACSSCRASRDAARGPADGVSGAQRGHAAAKRRIGEVWRT